MTRRILTLLLIVLMFGSSSYGSDSDDVAWVTDRYESVLREVFGRGGSGESLSPEILWTATGSIVSASDDPEFQFRIVQLSNGEIRASTTQMQAPLRQQLATLHGHHGSASADELAKLIAADRQAFGAGAETTLAAVVRNFHQLRTDLVVENGIVMDPRRYDLHVDGGTQHVDIALLGPSDGHGGHPLIRWMENTRAILMKSRPRELRQKE